MMMSSLTTTTKPSQFSTTKTTTTTTTTTSPKKFIESIVKNHHIVVFSKSWCPYCIQAKALLESPILKKQQQNVSIRFYDIDTNNRMQRGDGYSIEQELIFMTGGGGGGRRRNSNGCFDSNDVIGQRVLPSVWVNGKYLGGNDELLVAFSNGQLEQSLLQTQ